MPLHVVIMMDAVVSEIHNNMSLRVQCFPYPGMAATRHTYLWPHLLQQCHTIVCVQAFKLIVRVVRTCAIVVLHWVGQGG